MKRQKTSTQSSQQQLTSFSSSNIQLSVNSEDQIDEEQFEQDRKCVQAKVQQQHHNFTIEIKPIDYFQHVQQAYEYVRRLCLQSRLIQERSLLPIVWRHQLYSLFKNRTKVDLELERMIESNMIRILCHGESCRDNDAIVLMDDYVEHYQQHKNLCIDLFISKVVRKFKETEYIDANLRNSGFSSDAIKKLTNMGLLTINDLNHRQLSFAGLGILVRTLKQGRENLVKVLQKCKYSQLLQSELVKRYQQPRTNSSMKHVKSLGLEFHLYDLYGRNNGQLVQRICANLNDDFLIQLVLK